RPDGGGVDIDDIFAETASTDGCFAGRVELVRQVIQFSHKRSYFLFIELLEVARPIVFIAEPPDDDRRVVMVLFNHMGQHPASLRFIHFASQSAAAPGYL